jgi:hypothetical protein
MINNEVPSYKVFLYEHTYISWSLIAVYELWEFYKKMLGVSSTAGQ